MSAAVSLTLIGLEAAAAVLGFGPLVPFGVAAPEPAPPPAPAMAPAPVPPAAPSPRILAPITYVETKEPAVAITFDACATRAFHYAFDREVFNIVKRDQIPVTIFVSGRWVEAHPDVMAELAADPLVEFGDHSYDHPHMTQLPTTQIIEQIDQTEAALAKYGKHSVAFRPPFGEWSHRLVTVVQDLQLPTVTWDVVSGDPSMHTTADGMISTVLGKARAGSIIIFHINGRGWKTAQALPTILQGLRERGFRFVPLSQLLGVTPAVASPVSPVAPIPAAPAPDPTSPSPVAPIPTAALPPPPIAPVAP
jgi:peptidoglycan/xylan/chitin deacetylase (PgdA/CDA1 family)